MCLKWLLLGAKIKQHLCMVSAGILLWVDRQIDMQTTVLPAQPGVLSPTLCTTKASRLLAFPLVAFQEHLAGASYRSIPQCCHGDATLVLYPSRKAAEPPAPPQLFTLAALERKVIWRPH